MKKVLLLTLSLLFTTLCVFAYQTVIIKFPDKQLWVKAYYKKVGNEAILQYVPNGQSSQNWTKTVIIHSYKDSALPMQVFVANNTARMIRINPTKPYKTLRYRANDVIIGRCTDTYGKVQAQCEFFRAGQAQEGIISIHYINKNKEDFMANYQQWYDIIRKARFYYSYYRDERMMDKAEYFEL